MSTLVKEVSKEANKKIEMISPEIQVPDDKDKTNTSNTNANASDSKASTPNNSS